MVEAFGAFANGIWERFQDYLKARAQAAKAERFQELQRTLVLAERRQERALEEVAHAMRQRDTARGLITPQATKLSEALRQRGINNQLEYDDGHKHVDIHIPWARLNLEIDGKYHLTNPEHLYRDLMRDSFSHSDGIDTIRIPNSVVDYDLDALANSIAEVARRRKE